MLLLLAMSFWVGVVLAISELHYARKSGNPIARAEKWNLFFGLVLVFVIGIVARQVGVARESASLSFAICISGVVNLWALKHRIRRKSRQVATKPKPAPE